MLSFEFIYIWDVNNVFGALVYRFPALVLEGFFLSILGGRKREGADIKRKKKGLQSCFETKTRTTAPIPRPEPRPNKYQDEETKGPIPRPEPRSMQIPGRRERPRPRPRERTKTTMAVKTKTTTKQRPRPRPREENVCYTGQKQEKEVKGTTFLMKLLMKLLN
jgi:hypothetical protein